MCVVVVVVVVVVVAAAEPATAVCFCFLLNDAHRDRGRFKSTLAAQFSLGVFDLNNVHKDRFKWTVSALFSE